MSTDRLNEQKQEALCALIDDPSPLVRTELIKEFSRLGPVGIAFLESISNGPNRLLSSHARRLLAELRNSNPVEDFRSFIRSLNYELESGTILLCRVAYPELSAADICSQVDALAARCLELLIKPASPRERCLVINRVLFHEAGFRGNKEDYSNPDNSFLNRVFDTRKGLPITLSILYILVGQRLGAELDPIAFPGHFLVGSFEDDMPFYIDPFARGKFSTPEQLLNLSQDVIPLSQLRELAPTPIREVLTRCCRNLANHYAQRRQESMSQLYASFAAEFDRCYHKQTSK